MPVTPFHYPVAYLLSKLKSSFSLPALIVGAMIPDFETPFVWLWKGTEDRLVLHSLLGGLTLGTALAAALTVLVYPRITSAILPIDKTSVKMKCRFSLPLVFCAAVGSLSHVLLDIANHDYNPIFWPFNSQTFNPIVPLIGGELTASLVVHGLMVALFVGLFFDKRQNFWDRLLVG